MLYCSILKELELFAVPFAVYTLFVLVVIVILELVCFLLDLFPARFQAASGCELLKAGDEFAQYEHSGDCLCMLLWCVLFPVGKGGLV